MRRKHIPLPANGNKDHPFQHLFKGGTEGSHCLERDFFSHHSILGQYWPTIWATFQAGLFSVHFSPAILSQHRLLK